MDTLGMFLQYEGYEIQKARTVQRAIELLECSQPDLVLLDYMLQDDTAEPVVKHVRANFGDSVRIILLTAADDPEGKAGRMGTEGAVAKPFELDVLLRSVRDALTGPRRPGPSAPSLASRRSAPDGLSRPSL